MGKITDIVQAFLDQKGTAEKQKVVYQPTSLTVGPGTQVMIPANPVQPGGAVDFIVQIRGIGSPSQASSLGRNAVLITAEAGGISFKNFQVYGNPAFINNAVSQALAFLKKRYPEQNIHRGKLTISSFSGGGQAVAALVNQRDKIQGGVNKFVFLDGLHTDPKSPTMQGLVDYAREIKENPELGELSIVHTAIDPGKYVSTTETAEYIRQQLQMDKVKNPNAKEDEEPTGVSSAGGVKIFELYDKGKDYMVNGKVNVPGTSGWQHMQALKWGLKHAV